MLDSIFVHFSDIQFEDSSVVDPVISSDAEVPFVSKSTEPVTCDEGHEISMEPE